MKEVQVRIKVSIPFIESIDSPYTEYDDNFYQSYIECDPLESEDEIIERIVDFIYSKIIIDVDVALPKDEDDEEVYSKFEEMEG